MSSSITLFVPRVYCADETTGSFRERFGNDEMYLGAVYIGVSADKSFDVRVVRTRSVGDNFDDRETVYWNQELFTFDLGDPAVHPFPKAVLASLVLAEHDWGDGRNDFLETVAEEFRKKLTDGAIEAVTKAALAAAGVNVSGGTDGPVVRDHRGDTGGGGGVVVRDHRGRAQQFAGTFVPDGQFVSDGQFVPVGTAPGDDGKSDPKPNPKPDLDPKKIVVDALTDWAKEQIKEILDWAVDQVKSWAGDDVFPPVLKLLKIDSAAQTWNGSTDTPEEIAEFTGHDGKYQVAMLWQLRSTVDAPRKDITPSTGHWEATKFDPIRF
jgi:hypothetical protein